MQMVTVEFETECCTAQGAVDLVSSLLPNLRLAPHPRVISWNICSVDESVLTTVSHYVEDGQVVRKDCNA